MKFETQKKKFKKVFFFGLKITVFLHNENPNDTTFCVHPAFFSDI